MPTPTNLEADTLTAKYIRMRPGTAGDIFNAADFFHLTQAGRVNAQNIQSVRYADQFPSLKAAINDLHGGSGTARYTATGWKSPLPKVGCMFIPAGTITFSERIDIPAFTSIIGADQYSACLKMDQSTMATAMNMATGSYQENCALRFVPTFQDVESLGLGLSGCNKLADFKLQGPGNQTAAAKSTIYTPHGIGNTHFQTNGFGGVFGITLERLTIDHWSTGFGLCLNPTEPVSATGWIGRLIGRDVHIYGCGSGIWMTGDIRGVIFDDVWTEGAQRSSPSMAYGMCITTAMNVMMRMCVSEGNSWGWSIVGCKHVTMDTCYDEANTYGIDVSNNTNGFVISNCFHYGVAIAILLQSCHNGVVRNNIIQDSSQAFYLDGTCINLDIRNNYTNFLVTAGAGSVMAMTALKPRGCYIEFPTWGTEVQRMVAVDQTRFRRASPYGGSYQRKVLPVKVAAGAPDDATYGSWTGSIVFNKGDNKLYVRLAGSFGSPSAWLGAGLS